jgi:Acetohydroxy acid isomeroreductase, catalytic domain
MRWSVSDTAEYCDYTSGPKIVDDATKQRMQEILAAIKDGSWTEAYIADQDAGAVRKLRAAKPQAVGCAGRSSPRRGSRSQQKATGVAPSSLASSRSSSASISVSSEVSRRNARAKRPPRRVSVAEARREAIAPRVVRRRSGISRTTSG